MKNEAITIIAKETKAEMGGNSSEINNGYCHIFAKKLIDKIGRGTIIITESFSMTNELESYAYNVTSYTRKDGKDYNFPHAYVLIDGMYYDSYNTSGCRFESQMYHKKKQNDRFGFPIKKR